MVNSFIGLKLNVVAAGGEGIAKRHVASVVGVVHSKTRDRVASAAGVETSRRGKS